jgi:drug/metabolite transporter (DMT)-like permease
VLAVRFAPEERAHGIRLVGLFVGLLGVVLLLGIDVAGDTDELLGALCVLGATLGYAAGPMLAAKTLADLPPIAPVTGALAVSTVALLPLAIIDPPGGGVPFKAWGSVIVLGIACTAVALVVFFVLLTEAGPSRASIITYINPVVAVTLGVAFLNESLGTGSLLGLALILSGSYVSTLGSSRARDDVRLRRAPRGAPLPPDAAGRARPSASAAAGTGADDR